MAQVLVRDLDETVVARLKERARCNGRSLQKEAKSILEEAARTMTIDAETPKKLDLHLIADNYATHKHPKERGWQNILDALHSDIRLLAQQAASSA